MTRLVVYGVLAVLAIGALTAAYRSVYNRGWEAAMLSVSAQNQQAADVARKVQDDVDACYDKGGTWNVSKGVCS